MKGSIQQQVSVGDIHSGGGDVTVGPVITYHDSSEPQRQWRQALLRGPVAARQLGDELKEARELQETGNHQEAAVKLIHLARQVDQAGYESSADQLFFESAAEVAQYSPREAEEQHLAIARRQIDRADPHAEVLVQRLARNADHLPKELTGLLWHLHNCVCPDADEVRAGCEALNGRKDEHRWRARLTELAYLGGEHELALDVAAPIRDAEVLAGGDRLLMEMDALTAQEAIDSDAKGVDERWAVLLEWADAPSTAPDHRGLVRQRRGTVLAYRDQMDGAKADYVRAARAFSELPDGQEQSAAALFCDRRVTFLLGDPAHTTQDLTVAVALRGRSQTPAAIADQLTLVALHRLTDRKFREAWFNALRAVRICHRAGDLRGMIEGFHVLGRISEAIADDDEGTEEDRLAAIHYAVRAGNHKWAAEQALLLNAADELAEHLTLDGAQWERAASYAALGRRGREIPEPQYSAVAAQVAAEAEGTPRTPYANDVCRLARHAAAHFHFVCDPITQERILKILACSAQEGTIDDRHTALVALRQAHEIGLGDYRAVLLDDFLGSVPSPAVNPHTAGEIFDDSPSQERLVQAALDGQRAALEALSASGEAAEYPELVEICKAQVEGILDLETHGDGRLDGVRIATHGLYGAMVAVPLREQMAEKLVHLISDADDSRANRMEALAALWNLCGHLTRERASTAFDRVAPLALGNAPPSAWDSDADASRHPLQFFRRFEPQPDQMIALAVSVAADLADVATDKTEQLQEIVDTALHASSPRIRTSALTVLRGHPDLAAPPRMLETEDPSELAAQVELQLALTDIQDLPALEHAFSSPHFAVRRALLNAASAHPIRVDVLEHLATNDPDAYLRATACQRLKAVGGNASADPR